MPEPSENELNAWMARLAQGERDAFDPLFRALYPKALRLARARLGEDYAADAAQNILEKVFRGASRFLSGSPVLPWFYAIASNEIRAMARRGRHGAIALDPQDDAGEKASPISDNPERLLVDKELMAALEQAIESLDAQAAQAIRAVLGRGEVPEQSSAPAFRKRVSRAYGRLRLLLGGSYGA